MIVASFDLLDGNPIQLVFEDMNELVRFKKFYKEACDLFEEYSENYEDPNDYRGMGWVGQDGRP